MKAKAMRERRRNPAMNERVTKSNTTLGAGTERKKALSRAMEIRECRDEYGDGGESDERRRRSFLIDCRWAAASAEGWLRPAN